LKVYVRKGQSHCYDCGRQLTSKASVKNGIIPLKCRKHNRGTIAFVSRKEAKETWGNEVVEIELKSRVGVAPRSKSNPRNAAPNLGIRGNSPDEGGQNGLQKISR
jgi:hypothetical protein